MPPTPLLELVTSLATSLAEDPPDGGALVFVASGGTTGGALRVRPLDGHPLEALVGLVAPEEWDALGVVVHGTARHLDPAAGAPPERVVSSLFVLRSGQVVGRTLGVDSKLALDAPACGLVLDALFRTFGLPTPAPESDAGTWNELHAGACAGGLARLGIEPSWAAWFDAGSFSRQVIHARQRWV